MFSFPCLEQSITDMDKEQIVFLAGVTVCVLSIGAFIFWGPNPRPRKRGAVIGLQNLGLTCFLNTLLQSLASCTIFLQWLESCKEQGPVAYSLYYVLKVLSKERTELPASVEDPLAPSCVITALRNHGWSLGHGEQDAHELFHLLMVTLEEEAHKANAVDGGLSEVLESQPPPDPADCAGGTDECAEEPNHVNTNHVTPRSVESCLQVNQPSGDSPSTSRTPPMSLKLVNKHGELITRKVIPKYDCNRNYQASPFCGLLTSQLQCVKCGFKSVVRYDKFDSLSLHLPDRPRAGHRLCQLLDEYTQPEAVSGVACDGCNHNRSPPPSPSPSTPTQSSSSKTHITSTALKTLTIGKLPKCLCIHIHRMSIGPNGSPYKRSDYVDFPEYLVMDPYTHNAIIKEQKLKEENQSSEESEESSSNILPCRTGSVNHLYRLKAVVVHCGTVDSGHFVTYRRGPHGNSTRHRSDRWYFTSDETVRDATLSEAMQALAYMLFYEKCTKTPT